MTLDSSVNLAVDGLDEDADPVEDIVISWLAPLLPIGQVADARIPGENLPFILVVHLDGDEDVDCSAVDDLVSIHCLYPKGLGQANRKACSDFSRIVHRRMLKLARELEPSDVDGRPVAVDYVKVFARFKFVEYGDEQILRMVGRYRIGQSYANIS